MGKDPGPLDKKKPNPYNDFVKYSGLAFQLVGTIGLAGWLGYLLDNYLELKFPLFILIFTLTAFSGTIYILYRSLNK